MNSNKHIYIIVPNIDQSSPVKGAIALSNYLSIKNNVCLIDLSGTNCHETSKTISKNVLRASLKKNKLFIFKINYLKKIIKSNGLRKDSILISYCLPSDFISSFLKEYAFLVISIRGNIKVNYYKRFNFLSFIILRFHFHLINKFDLSATMNNEIYDLLQTNCKIEQIKIGNFIDELNFPIQSKNLKSKKIRFCFLGRLVKMKNIDQLLISFEKLYNDFKDIELFIIGDGPAKKRLENQIKCYESKKNIYFKGYIEKPINLLSTCHALVIPSDAEGTPRSALEALYLGIPCILKNTEGNKELISDDEMGLIYNEHDDLYNTLYKFYQKVINNDFNFNVNLLKLQNTQSFASNKLIKHINDCTK